MQNGDNNIVGMLGTITIMPLQNKVVYNLEISLDKIYERKEAVDYYHETQKPGIRMSSILNLMSNMLAIMEGSDVVKTETK